MLRKFIFNFLKLIFFCAKNSGVLSVFFNTDRILLKIFLRQKPRERVRGSGHVISRRSILHFKKISKVYGG